MEACRGKAGVLRHIQYDSTASCNKYICLKKGSSAIGTALPFFVTVLGGRNLDLL